MSFLLIVKCNLKQFLKNKFAILVAFIVPLTICLVLGFVVHKNDGKESTVYLVNEDKGELGKEFIKEIKKSNPVQVYEKEEGIRRLKKKLIHICYEIPEDFTGQVQSGNTPVLLARKTEADISEISTFEFNAVMLINKMILRKAFSQAGMDVTLSDMDKSGSEITEKGSERMDDADRDIIHVLLSFIFFDSMIMSVFLFELRKDKILERSMTTANRPGRIVSGILAAAFVFMFLLFGMVFLVQAILRQSASLSILPAILLSLACAVFVSISFGALLSGLCKNETMILIVTQLFSWTACFIGGTFAPLSFMPEMIRKLARFTPQYWAVTAIEGNDAKYALVAILFGLVFLLPALASRKGVLARG